MKKHLVSLALFACMFSMAAHCHAAAPQPTSSDYPKVGLYALFNWRHSTNDISHPDIYDPRGFDTPQIGAGFKLFPSKYVYLDLSASRVITHPFIGQFHTVSGYPVTNQSLSGYSARALLMGCAPLTSRFSLHGGVGLQYYNLTRDGTKYAYLSSDVPVSKSESAKVFDGQVPIIRLGFEYKTPIGLAFGLFGNYELSLIQGKDPTDTVLFDSQRYSLEPTVTLYF